MARKISLVLESEMGLMLSSGSLVMELPSLLSATASVTFFSSLNSLRRLASLGVTLPSIRPVISSSALAALSNFANCLYLTLEGNCVGDCSFFLAKTW